MFERVPDITGYQSIVLPSGTIQRDVRTGETQYYYQTVAGEYRPYEIGATVDTNAWINPKFYSGVRYGLIGQDNYYEDVNGMYGINKQGVYFELGTELDEDGKPLGIEQIGYYRYFPMYLTATVNGNVINVPIEWNFTTVTLFNNSGEDVEYTFTAAINSDKRYNYGSNKIGAVIKEFNILVYNRKIAGIDTNSNPTLKAMSGISIDGISYNGYVAGGDHFRQPDLPDYLDMKIEGKNEVVRYKIGGCDGKQVTENPMDHSYSLVWDLSKYVVENATTLEDDPNYGNIYLTALLTGPDGQTQRCEFKFKVKLK